MRARRGPRLSDLPPIVQAAQSPDTVTAARRYAALGFSVLPMRGKRPALRSWKAYQSQAASLDAIAAWAAAGRFHNVGLVCGESSGGLVILDLDGRAAYLAFASRFPHLAETFSVTTGSGRGQHVYLLVEHAPPNPSGRLTRRWATSSCTQAGNSSSRHRAHTLTAGGPTPSCARATCCVSAM